jgi:hypothetical protein
MRAKAKTTFLIHQIVLGGNISRLHRQCLDSWRALERRGFDVVRWTDVAVRDYLAVGVPAEVRALYRAARNLGEASDILRVAITYSYGGLYVDWDTLLLDADGFLAVMPSFEHSECVLLRDPLTTEPEFACAYDNSLFFLRRGNPLALDFLGAMERNFERTPLPDTPFLTGPLALTRFLEDHPEHRRACRFVDTRAVYAFDYGDVHELTSGQDAREILRERWQPGTAPAIHFWTHAWAPRPGWGRKMRGWVSRAFRPRSTDPPFPPV